MENTYRNLTDNEKKLLEILLENDFQGRDILLKQVSSAKVRSISSYGDNWGSLEFLVNPDIKADVKERIPVQATTYDKDQVPIQIFLHVVNGLINELEIVKADNSPIISPINPDEVHIDKVRHE